MEVNGSALSVLKHPHFLFKGSFHSITGSGHPLKKMAMIKIKLLEIREKHPFYCFKTPPVFFKYHGLDPGRLIVVR